MYARVGAVAEVGGRCTLEKVLLLVAAARPMSDEPNIIMREGFMNHWIILHPKTYI